MLYGKMFKFALISIILFLNHKMICRGFALGQHCRYYPFAPKCLGVAAKRSPSRSDIYQSLINKVLAEAVEENLSKVNTLTSTQPDLYDDKTAALSKLATMVLAAERKHDARNAFTVSEKRATMVLAAERKHDARNTFTDTEDTWSQQFGDYESGRGI
ncbi:uncharacterized protein LOC123536459 isoform X2 [Mercenaria mercenaria]|uniref:uncharacterized protein LOC123536459 isoform X2 n=1 Tax=Mercenaria mercenaria TaxID=6596 RepID=UPI00234E9841|nr:uncharacterized protein LOC123536459 isoform X2 [Mercenaria mercenaria]